jgi:uncharacterized OsmC-like protein
VVPTPHEVLLASLAGCIAITLRLYANHKGIALREVGVKLEFDRVHVDDCDSCVDRDNGWIDHINSQITIPGAFDEGQRKRLTQVARRCPVHKTLANGVQIFDSVVFAPLPTYDYSILNAASEASPAPSHTRRPSSRGRCVTA